MKKFLMLVTVLGLSFTGRASAQDSNRNEVRANLEKDGWTVVWGKNFTEADWALGTKAIAESIVARSPAPFLAWFDAVLQQNFTKIQQNLKGVAKADLERWLLQSLESKSIVTYKGFKIQAGFATYNREKRVIVEVPDGFEFQGIESKIKMKKVVNTIALPNWHQFYIRYQLVPQGGDRLPGQAPVNNGVRVGNILLTNDYGKEFTLRTYHPANVNRVQSSFKVDGKPKGLIAQPMGGDWQVDISYPNGAFSRKVRLDRVARHNGKEWELTATRVYSD